MSNGSIFFMAQQNLHKIRELVFFYTGMSGENGGGCIGHTRVGDVNIGI
jgi:hypothetical protein